MTGKQNHQSHDTEGGTVDPVNELLTEQELADRWRTSIPTLRRMRSTNGLPFVRIGRRLIRFDQADVAAWLERQKGSAA